MQNRIAHSRTALVIVALVLAAMACNLARQSDISPTTAPIPTFERPAVTILEPAEGATFNKGQAIAVKAQATGASGVTLVELLVNGVRVASQPPAEAISPTTLDVVLDYTPQQAGSMTLGVRAYSNNVVSDPVQRTITVLDPLDPGSGGQPGVTQVVPTATVYNPQCRARINTGLNFRIGPGTEYDRISAFTAGQEPPIIGYADRADGRWWQVMWGGQVGWISAAYSTTLGDCGAIRPAAIPASPTPVPSATPFPTQPGTTATPTLPDLQFSMLEGVSEIQLGADGTAQATYIIEIRNNGGQATGQFRMAVARPSGQIEYYDVPGLNPGQTFRVPSNGLQVTFTTPGVVRLLVTVDPDNTILESNELNNQAYRDITVNPGPQAAAQQSQAIVEPPPQAAAIAPPQAVPAPAPAEAQPLAEEAIPLPEAAALGAPPVEETAPLGESAPPAAQFVSPASAAIGVGNAAAVSELAVLQGHGGTVEGLAFGANDLLASASWDGTVRVWDAPSGTERLVLIGHVDRVVTVAFSPDGSLVASGSWDGTVRLWDANSGAELRTLDHGAEVYHIAFSPDGGRLVSGGANPEAAGGLQGLVAVWDIGSGSRVAGIQTFGVVSGVAMTDNDTVAASTLGQSCDLGGGAVETYNASSGELRRTFAGTSAWIDTLAISPNRGRLAASGQQSLCEGNEVVWVWSGSGDLGATLDHGSDYQVDGIAFNSDGSVVASASNEGVVRLWDAGSGAALATLSGHLNEAKSVAFSADGLWLASGGADGTVRLWGVP